MLYFNFIFYFIKSLITLFVIDEVVHVYWIIKCAINFVEFSSKMQHARIQKIFFSGGLGVWGIILIIL